MWNIHGIYSDVYILKEYTLYIPCIYMIFTWIFYVYYAHMLHWAADVAVEDRVPFHLLHQQ